MDYMELIKKSLSRAWKYKFLWLFGFFVAVADYHGGMQWQKEDFYNWNWHWLEDIGISNNFDFHLEPVLIAYLILAFIALWIIFFVLSIISEGALIFGVARKEKNEAVNFGMCWSEGLNKFFRLFGIILIATIVAIAIFFTLILILVPAFIASVPIGILLLLFAIPAMIVLIFIIVCVEGWAIRYSVLHDMTWIESINRGWILFKTNIGNSIGVALSSLFTQLVIGCGLIFALILIAIPFIILGTTSLWPALITGGGLILLILCFASAYFGTFASTIWTLGFMQITGLEKKVEPEITQSN